MFCNNQYDLWCVRNERRDYEATMQRAYGQAPAPVVSWSDRLFDAMFVNPHPQGIPALPGVLPVFAGCNAVPQSGAAGCLGAWDSVGDNVAPRWRGLPSLLLNVPAPSGDLIQQPGTDLPVFWLSLFGLFDAPLEFYGRLAELLPGVRPSMQGRPDYVLGPEWQPPVAVRLLQRRLEKAGLSSQWMSRVMPESLRDLADVMAWQAAVQRVVGSGLRHFCPTLPIPSFVRLEHTVPQLGAVTSLTFLGTHTPDNLVAVSSWAFSTDPDTAFWVGSFVDHPRLRALRPQINAVMAVTLSHFPLFSPGTTINLGLDVHPYKQQYGGQRQWAPGLRYVTD